MEFDQDMYDDNYDGSKVLQETPGNDDTAPAAITRRDDTLHLRGTDDMSTSDVHKYLNTYSTDVKPRIEWIDDTSLNLVYYTSQDASIALAHLTNVPTDQVDDSTLQPAQNNPAKPEARLTIRLATTADKKERGAKDRSRWYLFHPEDDPDTKQERRRRGSNGGKPYSRHGRRRNRSDHDHADAVDLFSSRLGTERTALAAQSPSGDVDDLFSHKGESHRRSMDATTDVFAQRIQEATKASKRPANRKKGTNRAVGGTEDDLFPRPNVPRSLAERIAVVNADTDLFAERILEDPSSVSRGASRISGGPIRSKGVAIRGAGRRTKASDLF